VIYVDKIIIIISDTTTLTLTGLWVGRETGTMKE